MWQGTKAAFHLLVDVCSFGCKSLISKIFGCAMSQSQQAMIVLTLSHVMVGRQITSKMIVLASSSASSHSASWAVTGVTKENHSTEAFVITDSNYS